ncbi:unnamed protein product [Mesocestoides corti]|uniref:Kinetochore protein NDC80 n=1 Tax=Mesocestoides corti TaxID=53468 RepID=A0A3P6GUE0_MESCO|nr:unnamed protein product [Mesocestoides corti]
MTNVLPSSLCVWFLQFLSDTGYEGQVSLKALQSPSQKLVFSIFSHIMTHFLPNFFVPTDKVACEDYFINTLKSFGYPVTLKRSTVTTPGAPHSASQILSALDWLRSELTTAQAKMDDVIFAPPGEDGSVAKLIFDLLLDCVAENTVEPPSHAREKFEGACAQCLGCRPEDVAELEAQLEELENQPSASNLVQQERELRALVSSSEREVAEQNDKLQYLSAVLPEAEAKAEAAASKVKNIRQQVSEIATEVQNLENLVSSQQSKFGDIVNSYQRLVEHYQQRLNVKQELVKQLNERTIELGRLDKPVAPALDEYNSLAVQLTDPSLPQLKMRSYLHTFDPVKEIPIICAELAEVHAKLKQSCDCNQAEVARKRSELASLESELSKKNADLERLEGQLLESKNHHQDLERQAALKKEALDRWTLETDTAISEASQSAEARRRYLKKVEADVKQYQKDYEYYLDLNQKMGSFTAKYRKEVIEFVRSVKERIQTMADRRRAEENKLEETMAHLESQVSQLSTQTEALISDAALLTQTAISSLKTDI